MTSNLKYIALFLMVLSFTTVTAQWVQIGSPVGTSTDNNQLAVKGDTLFMGVKIPDPAPSRLFYTLLSATSPTLSLYQTWGIVGEIDDAVIWNGEFTSLTDTRRLIGITDWYIAPFRRWTLLSSTPPWTMDEIDMQVHNDTVYVIGNSYDFNTSSSHVEVQKYDGSSWTSLGVTTSEILLQKANLIFVNNIPHISFRTSSADAVVLKLQSGQWIPVGPNSVVASGAGASQVGYMNNKLYMIYEDANDFYAPKMMVFENGVWNSAPNPTGYQNEDWKLRTYNNNLYLNQQGEHLQRFDGSVWTTVGGATTGYPREYQTSFDQYVDQNGNAFMSLTDDSQGESILLKFNCSTTLETRQVSSCNSYTSPSGRYVWTQSGTYLDTISNSIGCDLALTIQLTLNLLDTTITRSGNVLTANATNVSYQWIDCTTGIAISGAMSQSYTASAPGTYKCEITDATCTVTTSCQTVTINGVNPIDNNYSIKVFPNPSKSILNVDANFDGEIEYVVLDVTGKLMLSGVLNGQSDIIDVSSLSSGPFILKLNSDRFNVVKSVIKN